MEFYEFTDRATDQSNENTAVGYPEVTDDLDEGELNLTVDEGEEYSVDDDPDEEPDELLPNISDPQLEPTHAVEVKPLTKFQEVARERRRAFMEHAGHLHDETGVDTDRVRRFADAMGLRPAGEYIILPSGKPEAYKEGLKAAGINDESGEHFTGYFNPNIELTVVSRSGQSKDEIEESLVHEWIGHAAKHATPRNTLADKVNYIVRPTSLLPTSGFMSGEYGGMLEEGFPRWLDAHYTHATAANASENSQPSALYAGDDPYSPGAMAWDVLFSTDPNLLDVTLAARHSMEAKADMRARIDAVEPSLFARLMRVRLPDDNYEISQNFIQGLDMVMQAAGVTREDLPDICNNGPGMQSFNGKLAEYEQHTGYTFRKSA